MDLKESFIIIVATFTAGFLMAYLFKWLLDDTRGSRGSGDVRAKRRITQGTHACQCKHKAIGGIGDTPATRHLDTAKVSQRAIQFPRKARHNCSTAREMMHVDHPISKGKQELFSTSRRIALEELCMAFENTLIMMIFIVLFCNLIPEEKEAIQKSYWQIFVDGIWYRLSILINCVYTFMTQFGYVGGMNNF